MELALFDIEKVLNRLVNFIQFRAVRRSDLFQTECNELCDHFLKHQSYIISEIDLLMTFAQSVRLKSDDLMQSNEVESIILDMIEKARQLNAEVSARRHGGRAARMEIRRVAEQRAGTQYLADATVKYLAESDIELLNSFFDEIAGYYSDAEGRYAHDLKRALMEFSQTLTLYTKSQTLITSEDKKQFLERFASVEKDLAEHRDNAQIAYSEISACRDKVRIALTV